MCALCLLLYQLVPISHGFDRSVRVEDVNSTLFDDLFPHLLVLFLSFGRPPNADQSPLRLDPFCVLLTQVFDVHVDALCLRVHLVVVRVL